MPSTEMERIILIPELAHLFDKNLTAQVVFANFF